MIKIERGKRVGIKPVDEEYWYNIMKGYEDDGFIHTPDEHKKYAEFFRDVRKHPYKLYEYHTGKKLPLWKKIYLDIVCRFK